MSELEPNKSQLNAVHDVLCFLQFTGQVLFSLPGLVANCALCFMLQSKLDLLDSAFPDANSSADSRTGTLLFSCFMFFLLLKWVS